MNINTISAITITTGDTYQLKDGIAREKIEKKIYIKDKDNEGNDDLSVIKLSNEDYAKLVSEEKCLSNAIYILDDTFDDAYGRVLSNLGMTDDDVPSEAANKHYVDSRLSSIDLTPYVKKVDVNINYVKNDKKIYLSSDNHVTSIDTTDFIKDGMLSSVELCGNVLVMKFNTDAGVSPISVSLSSFANVYTAGYGLNLDNGRFSVDTDKIAELSDLTASVVPVQDPSFTVKVATIAGKDINVPKSNTTTIRRWYN